MALQHVKSHHTDAHILIHRSIRAGLTRIFGLPLFGKKVMFYFPVLPEIGLTKLLFFLRRKKDPKAYFDVLYLDEDLRVHKVIDVGVEL